MTLSRNRNLLLVCILIIMLIIIKSGSYFKTIIAIPKKILVSF